MWSIVEKGMEIRQLSKLLRQNVCKYLVLVFLDETTRLNENDGEAREYNADKTNKKRKKNIRNANNWIGVECFMWVIEENSSKCYAITVKSSHRQSQAWVGFSIMSTEI